MLDKWATAIGDGNAVAVLAIDLSKAFDCLDHESIRSAFTRLGMQDCNIIFDYLLRRKQYVDSNHFQSELNDILTGVPQGSILGPLLFILTLSDIEMAIDEFLHMFADDITTWTQGQNWQIIKKQVERILKELFCYLAYKGLKINMTKCHLMVLGKQYLRDVKSNQKLHIELFDDQIDDEPDITLLGIKIDNKLSFEDHVESVVKKCNDNIRFLWRTAKDRNKRHRNLLANAIVYSYLNYCDTVYHRFINGKLRKMLDGVHHRMLCFIYQVDRNQRISYITLCQRHKALPLDQIREVKLQKLIFEIINYQETVPSYLVECIDRTEQSTRHQSRSRISSNEIGRRTLNNIYCSTYSLLSLNIKSSSSVAVFFSKLSNLYKSYIDNVNVY